MKKETTAVVVWDRAAFISGSVPTSVRATVFGAASRHSTARDSAGGPSAGCLAPQAPGESDPVRALHRLLSTEWPAPKADATDHSAAVSGFLRELPQRASFECFPALRTAAIQSARCPRQI